MSILSTKTSTSENIERLKKKMTASEDMEPLNLFIDGKLKQRFKMAAVKQGVTMTDVLTKAIIQFVQAIEKDEAVKDALGV